MTWNFACSTTETSTWADGGRKFGELMEKATRGKVKVNVYATDQLTNGNQSEGIQALMNGDPVQISMHSNLIYSAFAVGDLTETILCDTHAVQTIFGKQFFQFFTGCSVKFCICVIIRILRSVWQVPIFLWNAIRDGAQMQQT